MEQTFTPNIDQPQGSKDGVDTQLSTAEPSQVGNQSMIKAATATQNIQINNKTADSNVIANKNTTTVTKTEEIITVECASNNNTNQSALAAGNDDNTHSIHSIMHLSTITNLMESLLTVDELIAAPRDSDSAITLSQDKGKATAASKDDDKHIDVKVNIILTKITEKFHKSHQLINQNQNQKRKPKIK